MPITLPATDPVTDYYRPLTGSEVVLVENTSVAWSVSLTRRYAKRKRIPLANIVSVAMGTTNHYDPGSNALMVSLLLHPVRLIMDAIGAKSVLVGPGTPGEILWRNRTNGSALFPTDSAYASLALTCANAREIDDKVIASGASILCYAQAGGGEAVPSYISFAAFYFQFAGSSETGAFADFRLGHGGGPVIPVTPDAAWLASYEGPNAEVNYLPTQTCVDALGAITNRTVVPGRIGIYWGDHAYTQTGVYPGAPWAETAETAATVVENALRYGEGLNPDNRYRQRIHIQLYGFQVVQYSLYHLAAALLTFGYDLTYAHRVNPAAITATYLPAAGSRYNNADLAAGRVIDEPYHVMVGDASNVEMFDEPYTSAWLPSGGGGNCLGPSESWCYTVDGLRRGAGGGLTNAVHIGGSIYTNAYTLLRCLLAGMSWAEAGYFTQQSCASMPAIGDPLLRPFPR